MKQYDEETLKNSIVAEYIGNDEVVIAEHGGMIPHFEYSEGTSFMLPLADLVASMEAFAAQIQEAVKRDAD